jgi:hypothetical protein
MKSVLVGLVAVIAYGCSAGPSNGTKRRDMRVFPDQQLVVLPIPDMGTDMGTDIASEVGVTDASQPRDSESPVCTGSYGPAQAAATPGYGQLGEASGIAPSRSRRDLLWLHNDSGHDPVLYGVGTDGQQRGQMTVSGSSVDWEDIATAQCPDGQGHCIWIGDIGDNGRSRTNVEVIAVREPSQDADGRAEKVWRFPVRYPDVPHDAEALVVSPRGDRFWIFEKTEEAVVRVFEHPGPLVDGQTTVLRETVRFPAPGVAIDQGKMVTSADLHPSGLRLLIRVYTGSYEYRLGAPLALDTLDTIEPVIVAFGPLSEPQGEAISYDEHGLGVWTISEDPTGAQTQPLHYYPCNNDQ